jgi:VWFA-related protein
MNLRFCSLVLAATIAGSFGSIVLDGRQQLAFRAGVDAVRVDAVVTAGGKPVKGLTAADFEVDDNGVAQTVTLADANARFNLILALDTSASVRGRPLRDLVQALHAALQQIQPGEQVALLTYDVNATLRSPLTADLAAVRRSLDSVDPASVTAMHDAVFAGLSFGSPEVSSLLLLFSDGQDNASWLSAAQVIDAARRSDVVIYPVVVGLGVPDPAHPSAGARQPWSRRVITALAEQTGGRAFRAGPGSTLRETFSNVLTEFRSRYLIAYTPTGVRNDDGWHRLEVRVKGRRADVRARPGYVARAGR